MAESEKELSVVEQKQVTFYDDELLAVRAEDGHIYVSLRHLCDSLGLARYTQVRKIREHEVLSEGYTGGIIMMPPGKRGGGGRQKAGLLRVDLIPMWLTTITASRVKEEVRGKIVQYQREAAKVLWEAFQDGRLTADTPFDELLAQMDNEAVQAYKIAQAVMKLAQNQILMEARLTGRIDDHEQRLEALETQISSPKTAVTEDQASQISQAVKAVAIALGKKTKRNEFGAVYGEMYRKFGITSYKLLPQNKFQEAMEWLSEWHQSIVGDEAF